MKTGQDRSCPYDFLCVLCAFVVKNKRRVLREEAPSLTLRGGGLGVGLFLLVVK